MVFKRKSYGRKKPTVFKSRKSLKQAAWKKSVMSIAKKAVYRAAETKHVVRSLGLAYNLQHNIGSRVADNLLYCSQGVNDGAVNSRIGDTVILRGVKLYLTLQTLSNTPGTSFRVIVAKVRKEWADQTTPPLKPITGINSLDPLDMEKCIKVLIDRRYTDRYMNTVVGLTTPPDPAEPIENTPVMMTKKIWIPLSGQYKYDDTSFVKGRNWQLACWVVAYLNRNVTGNPVVGTAAFGSEFWFKDP